MRLDLDLLDGPPSAGARVLALARAADAAEAAGRLADPADAEALHDLRVALRRLRSTLRALAPLTGPMPARALRRLRKAARRTGPARDLEVFEAWLGEAGERLPAPWRGAHDWLGERVARRKAEALAEVHAGAVPRVRRAVASLSHRLTGPERPARTAAPAAGGAPHAFGPALAGLLRAQAVALREAVRAVVGSDDVAGIHRVRIEGKRLRYLVEPLRGLAAPAGPPPAEAQPSLDASDAVTALKGLQDALGEWHDAWQARRLLAAALAEAAADRARWSGRGGGDADLRPGLLGLDRLAVDRMAAGWARLQEGWLQARATPLLDAVYAVVGGLEARAAAADVAEAPERRLLLTALPPEVSGADVEVVEQGWLPGDRPRESVGLVRSSRGERHFRARAAGRGAPVVTPLSRGDFEALWPLTDGRRLAHRSHRAAAAPGWRFDEYLDRSVVLAVAETAGDAEPPPWLEPVLVRDVTDERAYAHDALARRPARRGAVAGPPAAP